MLNFLAQMNKMANPVLADGAAAQRQDSKPKDKAEKQEVDREKNKSLLAHVGDTASGLTANVTKTAINQTTDAAKQGAKTAASMLLHTTFYPVTMLTHSLNQGTGGMAEPVIATLSKWLAPKIDSHLQKLGIKTSMPADQIVHNLIHGHYGELSDDVIDGLSSFVEKVMPAPLREALSSGNPLAIASATGMSAMGGVKDAMGQMKQEKGSMLTAPFKLLGRKTPFLNKLPKALQPWAAGGVALFLGKMILHGVKKLLKLAVSGALLATVFGFGKKILSGGVKAGGKTGGIGNLMGAVSGMAGGGGAPGGKAGGMMDMFNMASKGLGALSQMKGVKGP